MNELANYRPKQISLIELSSSFYEAILLNGYVDDNAMWQNYSKFKANLYQNIDVLSGIPRTHPSLLSNENQKFSPLSSGNERSPIMTNKNSKADPSPSINTLLYSNSVADPLMIEEPTFKVFQLKEKNIHSNNITEFVPTINLLLQKLDYINLEILQKHNLAKDYQGSRLVVPSKSAFYRVMSFLYVENLILGHIPNSKTILKNIFNLVYQGKLALKGPNSVNPSETLRNTFCGYIRELYRLSLISEKQAAATLYEMINHDPAFDQSMVSLIKEMIIFCLHNPDFLKDNCSKVSELETRKLIEDVKNSGEINDLLIDLVATILQVSISIYSVDNRDIKEKVFRFKPDGTQQCYSLKIISQNYKGYLNYFTLYTSQPQHAEDSANYHYHHKPKIEIKTASNFAEAIRLEQKEMVREEPNYLGKPDNSREMGGKTRTNPSTPNSPKKRQSTESPDQRDYEKSPEAKTRKATYPSHQQSANFNEGMPRHSDNSATLKAPTTSSKEMDFISPKGKQIPPTRSVDYKPGELKKLGHHDHPISHTANEFSAKIEDTRLPATISAFPNSENPEAMKANDYQERKSAFETGVQHALNGNNDDKDVVSRKKNNSDSIHKREEGEFFKKHKVIFFTQLFSSFRISISTLLFFSRLKIAVAVI